MNHKQTHARVLLPSLLTLVCLTLLVACKGASEEQDAPLAPVDNQVVLTGLTMNGYLANALVWVDLRKNDAPDGFEPFAYTDSQGYFSYNPNSGINYCESKEANMQRHCLKTGTQSGELVIKATKGVEILSGEAFRGVLSTKTKVQEARENLIALNALGPRPQGDVRSWQMQLDKAQLKLSPMTSIQAYLPDNISLKTIINNLGYRVSENVSDQDILSLDYIAGIESNDIDAVNLFTVNVSLSRLVDVLTVNFNQATNSLDLGFDGLPINIADVVYKGLAKTLVGDTASTAQTLLRVSPSATKTKFTSSNDLAKHAVSGASSNYVFPAALLIDEASQLLQNVLSSNNALTSNHEQAISTIVHHTALLELLENTQHSAQNYLRQYSASTISSSQLLALDHVLILPTLSEPIAFNSDENAFAIAAVSKFLRNPSNRVTDLLNVNSAAFVKQHQFVTQNTPNLDLSVLFRDLRNIARNISSDNEAQAALSSAHNALVLSSLANVNTPDDSSFWAGQHLSLSGVQDDVEQGQILAYFKGEANDSSGELTMCVAYRNDRNTSDNLRGKLFEGHWSVISGKQQNRLSLAAEGFAIQMKVMGETLGRDIAQEQQVASLPRMPNESYGEFGFTLNDDTSIWYSDHASVNQRYGLNRFDILPSNDSDCKDLLKLEMP